MGKIKISIPAQTIEAAANVEQVKKTSTKKATPKKEETTNTAKYRRKEPNTTKAAPYLSELSPILSDCELFQYYGNQMNPVIKSGETLIVKREYCFANLQPGALYLIHRYDLGKWMPFVGYFSSDTTHFYLNPQNVQYGKIPIERRKADGIYRILGKFSFTL